MYVRTKSSTLHISSIRFCMSVPVKAKQEVHLIFFTVNVRPALASLSRCASSTMTTLNISCVYSILVQGLRKGQILDMLNRGTQLIIRRQDCHKLYTLNVSLTDVQETFQEEGADLAIVIAAQGRFLKISPLQYMSSPRSCSMPNIQSPFPGPTKLSARSH